MADKTTSMRMIWAALLMGQVMMLGIIMVMSAGGNPNRDLARILVPATIITLVVAAAVAVFLEFSAWRNPGNAVVDPAAQFNRQLIRMALLEIPGMLGLVTFLLTRSMTGLVAFAVAFLLLVLSFPRRQNVRETVTSTAGAAKNTV